MTVMNTSIGEIVSLSLPFYQSDYCTWKQTLGHLWNFAGGPDRNCKVPQEWATNSQILNWWLPQSLLKPCISFLFPPTKNHNHCSCFVYWRIEILRCLFFHISLIPKVIQLSPEVASLWRFRAEGEKAAAVMGDSGEERRALVIETKWLGRNQWN